MPTRRSLIARGSMLMAGAATAGCVGTVQSAGAAKRDALFDDIAARTFRFFWETTNAANGLAPDRWPTKGFCSIAATGFALTAYPIGVDRGWITRAEAAERAVRTLRTFWNAPQGDAAGGMTGHKGFFYHFLDMETGARFGRTELSSVDTALLLGGVLFSAEYFDGAAPVEAEIRDLAHKIYARVDWRWMQTDKGVLSMGWHPENGFIPSSWHGYNEGMLVYILALGAPDADKRPQGDAWAAWAATYPHSWRGEGDGRHLAFAPHFGHQYSHVWVDFRGVRDATMREAGFDYFENSRRATYAQRNYAIANPMQWDGYSADIWGLTACDGPAGVKRMVKGVERSFRTYSARGPMGLPDEFDDGTLAPTAALGSIAFAPEIVEPCAHALHARYGRRLYGKYGFLDSFNPSFRFADVPLNKGMIDPALGWFDDDYLGIDQGPILAMMANRDSDFVWARMRKSAPIRAGLTRAGFTGGWLG
ncbi:glucoamylase family protein [Sphingomonas sp. CJ20]